MKTIKIDFDEANRIGVGINDLSDSFKTTLSNSNKIKTDKFRTYSNATVDINSSIQKNMKNASESASDLYNFFTEKIDVFRRIFEETKDMLNNDSNFSLSSFSDDMINGDISSIEDALAQAKMYEGELNGEKIYVANTPYSMYEWQKWAHDNGMYQNRNFLGSECATLAKLAGSIMMGGTPYGKTNYKEVDACGKFNKNLIFSSEDDMKKYIYNELINGRPVVIRVKSTNPEYANNGRHFVTGCALKDTVKSWEDVNIDTLVVYDNFNNEINYLSKNAGGRDFLDTEGGYWVSSANDDYISKTNDIFLNGQIKYNKDGSIRKEIASAEDRKNERASI